MSKDRLCIVILQHNSAHFTLQLLESLWRWEKANLNRYEVIVIDNASVNPMREEITTSYGFVHFITHQKNYGFASAHNRVWPSIEAPYTLLLNNDCLLLNDAIARTWRRMRADGADFATCALFNRDLTPQINFANVQTPLRKIIYNLTGLYRLMQRFQRLPRRARMRVGYVNGAFLLIRTELFRHVGMFKESYFMYTEDLDLMIRLHRAGACGYRYTDGKVVHFGGATANSVWSRHAIIVRQTRQLVDCMTRHFPTWQVSLWIYAEWLVSSLRGHFSSAARQRAQAFRSIIRSNQLRS